MHKPLQIGITGGIGSGKTLVTKIFACLGIPVYDADSHAKELMTTDGILISQIKKEFGDLSYLTDGTLNRKYLGEVVFNQQEKLDILNSLVHPRVRQDFAQWTDRYREKPYVIREAALLFETGVYRLLDRTIVVYAPEDVRIRRVMKRDNRPEAQVRAIIRKQLSEEEKKALADDIIYNDDSILVIPQVLELHHRLLQGNA
ncbi:dephospho-CoA kinase [Dawidia soli]|uniref:Dephospho-CoA kinase n=1 Tax=Dawidia soli TaxID=2782352 RepID=A0AAP2D9W4_9BACT|nr:dephospho-CoA kinase [Dawidia soli]MBT1685287.1 dephospho-CoA kinase [Dawidia soli]